MTHQNHHSRIRFLTKWQPAFERRDDHPVEKRMTESAYAFLSSLRELDFVDEEMEEDILDRLMNEAGTEVGLEDIRKVAASVVFTRQFGLLEEYVGLYEEEWKILFN